MKRPWNLIDSPIYSLATYNEGKVNMNICTYVTAISMEPKLYAVAIYDGTKSLANMLNTDTAILQLLNSSQYSLVRVLGKQSGLKYDKENYLKKKGVLTQWLKQAVLKDACALIHLKKQSYKQNGDHVLFIFSVLKYKTFREDVLTTKFLREKKIIRA